MGSVLYMRLKIFARIAVRGSYVKKPDAALFWRQ